MTIKSNFLLKYLCFFTLLSISIISCKKDNDITNPIVKPDQEEEEIVPGKTVGLGVIPLEKTEYQKIRLIDEPNIDSLANLRIKGVADKEPNLSKVYDLSSDMPPIGNQKKQSSCVAWAVAYATRSYFKTLSKNNTPYFESDGKINYKSIFSPAFVYNQINNGGDNGSHISDALELVKNTGVCTWESMPYSSEDYLTKPSSQQIQAAASNKILNWGRVNINTNTFRKFLYYNHPIIICQKTDGYFSKPEKDGSGEYFQKKYTGDGGYHAIVIVGYDDNKKAFKVQNSWGTNWANKGFIWLSYDIVQVAINEAYVMINEKTDAIKEPKVVTGKAVQGSGNSVTFSGSFASPGDLAVQHFGFCIGATKGLPTEQYRINEYYTTSGFSLTTIVAEKKVWYRAYAQTPTGIIYGDTLSIQLNAIEQPTGISKNTLIFYGSLGKTNDFQRYHAIDLDTGLPIWKSASSVLNPERRSDGTYYSGVFSNNQYVFGNGATMQALSLSNGELKWENQRIGTQSYLHEAYAPITVGKNIYAISSKEIVGVDALSGALIWSKRFTTFGDVKEPSGIYLSKENKVIFALNASDYKDRLHVIDDLASANKITSLPASFTGENAVFDNNLMIINDENEKLSAYKTSTFSKIWECECYMSRLTLKGTMVIGLTGSRSFVNTSYKNGIFAIDKNDGSKRWEYNTIERLETNNLSYSITNKYAVITTKKITNASIPEMHVIEINSGRLVWKTELRKDGVPYVLATENIILLYTSDNATITALNISNGNTLWKLENIRLSSAMSVILKDGRTFYPISAGMQN